MRPPEGAAVVGGVQRWLGPYGGSISTPAVSPANANLVLLGSSRGVFRSLDGGATWAPSSVGLTNLRVSRLVWDPHAPTVVYAGTQAGLFRSADAGMTWTLTVQPGPLFWPDGDRVLPEPVLAILASHTTPGRLYAANEFGVHRSDDSGTTWTRLHHRQGWRVDSLHAAAGDDSRLYLAVHDVATGEEESLRSDDGGLTWQPITPPAFGSFVVSPTDPDTVFVVDVEGFVVRSSDGGETWASVWDDGALATSLAVSPSDPASVYLAGARGRYSGTGAFLARSSDGGVTWADVQWFPSDPGYGVVSVSPHSGELVLFGSTATGLRRSTDGGDTFVRSNVGLSAAPAVAIAADPTAIATWYASLGSAGTFRTSDAGLTWTDVTAGLETSPDPLRLVNVHALAVDAGGAVYAASVHTGPQVAAAVFRSNDRGATWTDTAGPFGEGRIIDLLAHPTNPGTLLATLHTPYGDDLGGVYRTTDGGDHWTEVSPHGAIPTALALDAWTTTVYATLTDGQENPRFDDRLFSSDDFGQTWQRLPFPPDAMAMEPTSIAVTPTGRIILGGERGSFVTYTDDRGNSWNSEWVDYTGRADWILTLAVDPLDPLQVLAGTAYGGTWLSRDAGVTWLSTTPGIYGEAVHEIAFPRPFASGDPLQLRRRPALLGGSGRSGAGVALFTPKPHNINRPRIGGPAAVGRIVLCRRGRWSRSDAFTYRWARAGSWIAHATDASYEVRRADKGHRIHCRVRAAGPGGTAFRRSASTRVGSP